MDDRRWIPYLARVFALTGLYFAGAKLGQAFSLTGGKPRILWTRARAAEVIALMLTLVLVCGVVFGDWFFQGRHFIPAFVVFPLLLWAP